MFENQNVSFIEAVCRLSFKIIHRDDEDADGCYACLLLLSMLINCVTLRAGLIPVFMSNIIQKFTKPPEKETFKVLLLEVVEASLAFEPLLSFKLLNDANVLIPVYLFNIQFIDVILQSEKTHTTAEEKAIYIYCFSSLLQIPYNNWPLALQERSQKIVESILNQFVDLHNKVSEDKEEEHEGDDFDAGDEGYAYPEDDWGYEEEKDALDQDELRYSKILEKLAVYYNIFIGW